MNIKGKIIVALPEMSGTSKAGNPWKKREYVLENTDGQYPRQIHFDFFGDKADQYPLQVGDTIDLSFDIESREYNGRWFTSIRGWKAEKIADNAPAAAATVAAPTMPQGTPQPPIAPQAADEDLPF
ncbi:MAG: DUF3127 domain-containing protein [Muribaculaceae bacterium]